MSDDVRFDWQRSSRTGIPEVVFAQGKTIEQLESISRNAISRQRRILMTRVDEEKARYLVELNPKHHFWHEPSRTLVVDSSHDGSHAAGSHLGTGTTNIGIGFSSNKDASSKTALDVSRHFDTAAPPVAIVSAGTSDAALVAEVEQCLLFLGVSASSYLDVGVAGLWRLTELADELRQYSLYIAVAGMEGALFSVLAGLVKGPVIAVPTSVGYGVSEGGHAALNCALSSCAPGIAVVNIDNGFGAAALALKMLDLSTSDVPPVSG